MNLNMPNRSVGIRLRIKYRKSTELSITNNVKYSTISTSFVENVIFLQKLKSNLSGPDIHVPVLC